MSLTTDLQVFYPLSADTDENWNGDNATNSGISFGTHSGVASADFTDPDYAFAANSAYNFSFGTGDFTFSVWLNPDVVSYGVSSQGTIFGTEYPNYEFTIYQGDIKLYLDYPNGITTNSGSAITTGAWQHVVVVRSGGVVTIYIDDAVPSQANINSPGSANITSTGTPQFEIGKRVNSTSSNFYYDGKMSDALMWSRALSALEITQIYNAGAGNFSTLIPADATLRGMFSSVVHTVAPENGRLHGMFGSVVHSVASENGRLHGMFMSVVHDTASPGGGGSEPQGHATQGGSLQGHRTQGLL